MSRGRSTTEGIQGRILIVESGRQIADLIRPPLSAAGYVLRRTDRGLDALRLVRGGRLDVIVLEGELPDVAGLEVCQRLRTDPEPFPGGVIIVSEKDAEDEKLKGFEAGADDYVTQPFLPRELLARIRALARRRRSSEAPPEARHFYRVGRLELDRYRFEVTWGGFPVEVTRTEFDLLALLMGSPGRVFRREEMLGLIWGQRIVLGPRAIDAHMTRLRRRLRKAGVSAPPVEAIRGVGYRLRESE